MLYEVITQFTVYDSSGFTYTVNGGTSTAGTSPINLTGLIAGSYTIVVTDTTTGCTANETIPIKEPLNPVSLTATATNVHCNNFNSVITSYSIHYTKLYESQPYRRVLRPPCRRPRLLSR